ncbi:MAG: hypothetical protein AB1758_15410 [Candidatus Eremiobacterota bacterium]
MANPQSKAPPKRKPAKEVPEKVYRSTMKRFLPLALLAVGAIGMLVIIGLYGLKVSALLHDPMYRFLGGYFPFILAGMLALTLAATFATYSGKAFRFLPEGVVYEKGKYQLPIRWRNLTLVRPNTTRKGPFLVALISDGTQFARIEKFFFDDFDQMLDEMDYERRASRSEHTV